MTLRHKARADYMVFVVKNGRPQSIPQWVWSNVFEQHGAGMGLPAGGRVAKVPECGDLAGRRGTAYQVVSQYQRGRAA